MRPGRDAIQAAAGAALRSVAVTRHRIGEAVTRSVIDAALHVAGVQRVTLQGWTDVICDQIAARG
jgi:phage-related baseplate assembly protein